MTAIDDLRRGGMDPREAEQIAIERFGAPEAIRKHHESEAGGMTLWLTRILTVPAAVTIFVAAVVVIHSLVFDDGSAARGDRQGRTVCAHHRRCYDEIR
jgi:hypothetical protein